MSLCRPKLFSCSSSSFCKKKNLKRFYTNIPQHQLDEDACQQQQPLPKLLHKFRQDEVGIVQFVGNHPRIKAVSKDRCADFQVHEIDLKGQIVHLTDLGPPPENALSQEKEYYLHCTLYKEGASWPEVLKFICRKLGLRPSSIACAGMKDRIAKTSQRISVANGDVQKFIKLSESSRRIKFGNFSYSKRPITLGHLTGNNFSLVLKNLRKSKSTRFSVSHSSSVTEDFERAVESLREFGFVNYYGLQRFGTGVHLVGQAILQNNCLRVYDLLMQPKSYDPDFLREAKTQWLLHRDTSHFFKTRPKAFKKLHNSVSIRLFHGLEKCYKPGTNNDDLYKALQFIPLSFRSFYYSAAKSYFWNLLVDFRLQKFGLKPVPGDFVYCGPRINAQPVEDDSILLDGDDIDNLNGMDLDHNSSSLMVISDNDADGHALPKNVKVLTETDLNDPECPYTIHDVVLPSPGYKVDLYSMPEVQSHYEKLLKEHDMDLDCFTKFKKNPLWTKIYRPIVVKPGNLVAKVMPYRPSDDTDKIIPSDLDLLTCPGLSSELSSPGVKQSHLDPVIGNDEEKINKICAILSFSLPRCSYATMALREVLKW